MEEFRKELVKIAMNSLLSNTKIMEAADKVKTTDGKTFNLARSIARLSVDCADEVIEMMYRR